MMSVPVCSAERTKPLRLLMKMCSISDRHRNISAMPPGTMTDMLFGYGRWSEVFRLRAVAGTAPISESKLRRNGIWNRTEAPR